MQYSFLIQSLTFVAMAGYFMTLMVLRGVLDDVEGIQMNLMDP